MTTETQQKAKAPRVTLRNIAEGAVEYFSENKYSYSNNTIALLMKLDGSAKCYLSTLRGGSFDTKELATAAQVSFLYAKLLSHRDPEFKDAQMSTRGVLVRSLFAVHLFEQMRIGGQGPERADFDSRQHITMLANVINVSLSERAHITHKSQRLISSIVRGGMRFPSEKSYLDYVPLIAKAFGRDGSEGAKKLNSFTMKILDSKLDGEKNWHPSYYLRRYLKGGLEGQGSD
ncbi:MAG TPA: hypothetical protein VND15_03325 [Candidatus Acidoferrales bacterium]|nr:hypothetical protein [Candidatus Acidoferrales bacterium]